MKIVITGSNSQLAISILNNLKNTDIEIFSFNKTELDITNYLKSNEIILKISPDLIINCAAYTNVNNAEQEKNIADNINNFALKNLSNITNDLNCNLLHFSTDYVFNGSKIEKYTEQDIPEPKSVYGKTKLDGEYQLTDNCNNFLILRISWLFSEFKNNFVCFILDKLSKNEDIFCVHDQISIPTCANDVSKFILLYINGNMKKSNKMIYHLTNNGNEVSWYEFAKKILSIFRKYFSTNSNIIPVDCKTFFKNNIRPRYSALNNNKIQKIYNFEIDNWEHSLSETIKNYCKK